MTKGELQKLKLLEGEKIRIEFVYLLKERFNIEAKVKFVADDGIGIVNLNETRSWLLYPEDIISIQKIQ